jgi:predicted PurR-regulated permease PerM
MKKQDSSDIQEVAALPRGMIIAGAWSWRALALFAVFAVLVYVLSLISEVVIPFVIAILIAAVLTPVVNRLRKHGWPKGLAIATSLVGTFVIIAGLFVLITTQIHSALPQLKEKSSVVYQSAKNFLVSPAVGLNQQDIDNAVQSGVKYAQENSSMLTSGITAAGTTFGHIIVGLLLTLFTLIFLLIDGKRIWRFFLHLFPRRARPALAGSGDVSWTALKNFVRSQVIVAGADGLLIGLGAFFVGLPLAIPIGILVFLGSFIPVVGAILTGAVAIVIALVFNGPIAALIMLLIVVGVQQLEGHVLQPFLIGRSVNVHPLAVVLGVAIGSILGGIAGALFAVPLVAVMSKTVGYISNRQWEKEPVRDLEKLI